MGWDPVHVSNVKHAGARGFMLWRLLLTWPCCALLRSVGAAGQWLDWCAKAARSLCGVQMQFSLVLVSPSHSVW